VYILCANRIQMWEGLRPPELRLALYGRKLKTRGDTSQKRGEELPSDSSYFLSDLPASDV
jgi:hypothetical protein